MGVCGTISGGLADHKNVETQDAGIVGSHTVCIYGGNDVRTKEYII